MGAIREAFADKRYLGAGIAEWPWIRVGSLYRHHDGDRSSGLNPQMRSSPTRPAVRSRSSPTLKAELAALHPLEERSERLPPQFKPSTIRVLGVPDTDMVAQFRQLDAGVVVQAARVRTLAPLSHWYALRICSISSRVASRESANVPTCSNRTPTVDASSPASIRRPPSWAPTYATSRSRIR